MSNINVLGKKLNNVDVMKFEKQEGGHAYYVEGEYLPNVNIDLPIDWINASNIYFAKVTENKWLVSSSTASNRILLYNSITKTTTNLYDNTSITISSFRQVSDTKWLLFSNSRLTLLYNSVNDSIIELNDASGVRRHVTQITDFEYLLNMTNVNPAYYNSLTDEYTQINTADGGSYPSTQSPLSVLQITDNEWLLSASRTNWCPYIYDNITKTASRIAGISLSYPGAFVRIENKVIISSSSVTYIYSYDISTKTAKRLSPTGSEIHWGLKITDNIYIITSQSQIYTYNINEDELVSRKTNIQGIREILQISEFNFLVYSNVSRSMILKYDSSSDEFTELFSSVYILYHKKIDDNTYILFPDSGNLLIYDVTNDTITRSSTSGVGGKVVNYYDNIPGKYLFTGESVQLVYDIETGVFTRFTQSCYNCYPMPADDGTNNYIFISDDDRSTYKKMYYNITDNTLTKLTYKLQ